MEKTPKEGLLLVLYATRVREASIEFSKAQFKANQN